MESQVSLTLPHCRGEVVRMRRIKEGREDAHGSDLGGRDGEVCESSLDGERGEESDGKESGVHRWATCKRVEQGAQAEGGGGLKGRGSRGSEAKAWKERTRTGEMKSKRGHGARGSLVTVVLPKHAQTRPRHATGLIRRPSAPPHFRPSPLPSARRQTSSPAPNHRTSRPAAGRSPPPRPSAKRPRACAPSLIQDRLSLYSKLGYISPDISAAQTPRIHHTSSTLPLTACSSP